MNNSSFLYLAGAFFAYVLYLQIRQILEYRSAEKRATVPVDARVVELREEERTERGFDIDDRTQYVKKIVQIPIWEYEVNGAEYRQPAKATEGKRTARVGETETLYIDPQIPWEPWHEIGAEQCTAITKTIILTVVFLGIMTLIAYTPPRKSLMIGAPVILAVWFLFFRRGHRISRKD